MTALVNEAHLKREEVNISVTSVPVPDILRDKISQPELTEFLELILIDSLYEMGIVDNEENTISIEIKSVPEGTLNLYIRYNRLESRREFIERIDSEISRLENLKSKFPDL